jgi:hypothetical protein
LSHRQTFRFAYQRLIQAAYLLTGGIALILAIQGGYYRVVAILAGVAVILIVVESQIEARLLNRYTFYRDRS